MKNIRRALMLVILAAPALLAGCGLVHGGHSRAKERVDMSVFGPRPSPVGVGRFPSSRRSSSPFSGLRQVHRERHKVFHPRHR